MFIYLIVGEATTRRNSMETAASSLWQANLSDEQVEEEDEV